MNPDHPKALDAEGWKQKLKKISQNLKTQTELTLMGSGATMLCGQDFRASMDLDVWKPTSSFDPKDLQQAVEAAGLLLNPQDEDPSTPYIQIVEPGICQLGEFKPRTLQTEKNLSLTLPPPENLIASKLKRANPKDLEDIAWTYAHEEAIGNPRPATKTIRKIIKSFPKDIQTPALENLVLLDVVVPQPNQTPTRKNSRETTPSQII
jgi:hypothetical protein